MRALPILSVLFFAACEDVFVLTEVCEPQCWIDSAGTIRTDAEYTFVIGEPSECRLGFSECHEGDAVGCVGFIGPGEEQCDLRDNDCDGPVDEDLNIYVGHFGNPCPHMQEGICKLSDFLCLDGEQYCIPTIPPGEEVCDNLDNDCDGDVDEIPESYFYPSEDHPNTAGIGECRPGVCRCTDGGLDCMQPITPSRELCSTNRDEDCDGATDESEGPLNAQFAMAIDISGSMSDEVSAVTMAICDWALEPQIEDSQFAIMLIADQWELSPHISILQDFSDVLTTCDNMTWLNTNFMLLPATGSEFQPAAMVQASALTWDPQVTDRHMLIFTDESLQTSYVGEHAEAEETCLTFAYNVGVFTEDGLEYQWDPMVATCGGFVDEISSGYFDMYNKLVYHFSGRC